MPDGLGIMGLIKYLFGKNNFIDLVIQRDKQIYNLKKRQKELLATVERLDRENKDLIERIEFYADQIGVKDDELTALRAGTV